MKKSRTRIVLLVLVLAVVGIQFIPVDRSNPTSNPDEDFIAVAQLSPEISVKLKQACFDCHSNYSRYPWYSYVAPSSFFVANHIKEGREELNFSVWTTYSTKKQIHKLEECIESLREGWMPLDSYVLMHNEADLSTEDRNAMATEMENVLATIKAEVKNSGASEMNESHDDHEHEHQHEGEHSHE